MKKVLEHLFTLREISFLVEFAVTLFESKAQVLLEIQWQPLFVTVQLDGLLYFTCVDPLDFYGQFCGFSQ